MPSRSKIFAVCTPLVAPVFGSEKVTDFAASSVLRSASGVPMSGFGAPRFTAMPISERAISICVPGSHFSLLGELLDRFRRDDHQVRGLARIHALGDLL